MARTGSWPTPTAADADNDGGPAQTERNTPPLNAQVVCGRLNPDWVEWLMGWPVGWTALKQLGDPSILGWTEEPPSVPRTAARSADRRPRLRTIGNGQVPVCAAVAWSELLRRAEEWNG